MRSAARLRDETTRIIVERWAGLHRGKTRRLRGFNLQKAANKKGLPASSIDYSKVADGGGRRRESASGKIGRPRLGLAEFLHQ